MIHPTGVTTFSLNMSKVIYLLLLGLWVWQPATAQHPGRRFALKVDLTAPIARKAALEAELRLSPQSSGVLYVSHQWFDAPPPSQVFQGDWSSEYALRLQDSIPIGGVKPERSSGWIYVGEGRRLPTVAQTIPLWSTQCRIGWRKWWGQSGQQWRFFAQPALSFSMSRIFSIHDSEVLTDEKLVTWNAYLTGWRVVQQTNFYRQAREMRLREQWSVGPVLDVGATCRLRGRLFLEGRASGGFNTNPMSDYSAAKSQHRAHAQAMLLLGYTF